MFLMCLEYWSLPFIRSISQNYWRNRYIKKPVSLAQMRRKLEHGRYTTGRELTEWRQDMNLMVANAKQYNLPDSPIIADTTQLLKIFSASVAAAKAAFKAAANGSGRYERIFLRSRSLVFTSFVAKSACAVFCTAACCFVLCHPAAGSGTRALMTQRSAQKSSSAEKHSPRLKLANRLSQNAPPPASSATSRCVSGVHTPCGNMCHHVNPLWFCLAVTGAARGAHGHRQI